MRLTVTDTGCGMIPEVQAQIFTPFFTTKTPSSGIGLGLAIVHGIVEQWGGWIALESAIGEGTRFSIYFPRRLPAAAFEPSADVPPGIAATGSVTILFVEDDECIRTLGREYCGCTGSVCCPRGTRRRLCSWLSIATVKRASSGNRIRRMHWFARSAPFSLRPERAAKTSIGRHDETACPSGSTTLQPATNPAVQNRTPGPGGGQQCVASPRDSRSVTR